MAINENKLAQEVAKREGGKKNVSIGQIKEVQKLIFEVLGDFISEDRAKPSDVLALVEKHS